MHRPERALLAALGIVAASGSLAAMQVGTRVAQNRSVGDRVAALAPDSRAIRLASFTVAGQSEPYQVLDRLARDALTPLLDREPVGTVLFRESTIGGAYIGIAAADNLRGWLALRSGRYPRSCTAARCEVVQIRGRGRIPNVPGLRLVRVGRGDFRTTTLFGDAIAPAKNARAEAALGAQSPAGRYHLPAPPPIVLAEGVAPLIRLPLLDAEFRTYGWVVPIDRRDVRTWSVSPLTRAIEGARTTLEASSASFELRAPIDELKEATEATTVAGRRLLLLTGQTSVLLLAFALVAAARLRRNAEAARMRLAWLGAPRWQHALSLLAETALLSLGATAVGWALGIALGAFVARAAGEPVAGILAHSFLTRESVWLALGLAGLATLALVTALVIRPIRLRGLSLSVLDMAALGAAGAVAMIVLRGRTDTSAILAEQGTGIALLLLPGLIAFVAAVALARLLPIALLALERLTPARALSARLSALALVRNPGYAAVAVAFVGVSLGLAVFAASYGSTLAHGQRDQARFATGADFTLREDLSRLIPVRAAVRPSTARTLGPDVDASAVARFSGSIRGARDVTGIAVLGLEREALAAIDGWRADFASDDLRALGERIAPRQPVALAGANLPHQATRLALTVAAKGRPLSIAASIQNHDGTFASVDLGSVPLQGTTTLSAALRPGFRGRLIGLRFDPPLRLVERGADAGGVAQSTVTLGPLRADANGRSVVVTRFRDWRGAGGVRKLPGGAAHLRITVTEAVRTYFRPRQPTDDSALPMIVSPRLAGLVAADGRLSLDVAGTSVIAHVTAVATRFPGTKRGTLSGDFAIADRDSLLTALNAAEPGTGATSELWVQTSTQASREEVSRRLQRAPFDVLALTDQHRLERNLRNDPLARASQLILVVAASIAALLAFLGLALGVVSELRDERGELFDLESQGFGPAQLRRQLRLRAATVVGFGLAGAAALGFGLSLLVIAVVAVTANVGEPEPPLVLAVDWPILIGILAAPVAASAIFVAAVTSRAFRAAEAGRYGEVGT